MPPRVTGGEDTQPNELRPHRKGADHAPLIRLTTPRGSSRAELVRGLRGGGQGYPRGTNRGSRGHHNPGRYSHVLARSNHPHFSSRGRIRVDNSSAGQSHRTTENSQEDTLRMIPSASSRIPQASSAPTNSSKRPSIFPNLNASPPKRLRRNTPPQRGSSSRYNMPSGPRYGSDGSSKGSRIDVVLDLPSHCWKGVHGYQKSRMDWLSQETNRIQMERKVKVYHSQAHDRKMMLYCRADETLGSPIDIHERKREPHINVVDTPAPSHTLAAQNQPDGHSKNIDSARDTRAINLPTINAHLQTHTAYRFRSGTLTIKAGTSGDINAATAEHIISDSPPITSQTQHLPLPCHPPSQQRDDTVAKAPNQKALDDLAGMRHVHDRSPPVEIVGTSLESERILIPQTKQDRTRRILLSSSKQSIAAVTSHGSIDRVDLYPLRYCHPFRKLDAAAHEQVDDACLLTTPKHTIVVLGHARDHWQQQISLVTFDDDSSGRELASKQLARPRIHTKKGGISAVSAMMQPRMFASGGYDHAVHIWTADEDFSSATSSLLATKHNSLVQSILPLRDNSHKIITASADGLVTVWDLSSERVVNSFKVSNSVFHAHTTSLLFCTLLEVAHRELQFEVRDHRMVPEVPVQRFGYEANQIHGRFIKGDTQSHIFACGGRDGLVRIWDMRNPKTTFSTLSCYPATKIVQVIFEPNDSSNILVCSANNELARVKYTIL